MALSASSALADAPYVGYSEGEFIKARHLENPIYPEETAALLELAGAQVQRMAVSWRRVEEEPGHFHWAPYGRMVRADEERGIRPLFVVMNAPLWAVDRANVRCRHQPCNLPPDAAHSPSWRRFVYQLVTRFPTVVAVEVWNEPNAPGKWQTATGPNAPDYIRVLCNAAAAVRSGAPGVPVLTGSLNLNGSPSYGFRPYQDFLRGIYEQGGRGCFDGIGLHAYPQSPDIPPADRFLAAIDGYRNVAAAEGDAGRGLWLTEFGFATPPERRLSEVDQARGTLNALNTVEAMPDIRAALIFSLLEGLTDPGFGQVTREYHAKRAFCLMGTTWTGTDPCGDRDGDGFTDVAEVRYDLDWNDPDMDDDGTLDGSDSFPLDPASTGPGGAPPLITSAPPHIDTVPRGTFAFTSTLQGARYECRLNVYQWTRCPSPTTYFRLRDGEHRFQVRVLDARGYGGNPAGARFIVDTGPPTLTLTMASSRRERRRHPHLRRFHLDTSEHVDAIYCALDTPAWSSCKSPFRTGRLERGRHTISARAVDDAGNVSEIASMHFRIQAS